MKVGSLQTGEWQICPRVSEASNLDGLSLLQFQSQAFKQWSVALHHPSRQEKIICY
jgi:hypothetical protein